MRICKHMGFILLLTSQVQCSKNFGGWAISEALFTWICKVLPVGSTILEMGSGFGSGQLAKHYTLYSVENNRRWLNKYKGPHYIYAPIRGKWYDVEVLRNNLPQEYNLILVDGPLGRIGRAGFYHNLDLFNTDGVIIVIDDIHRKAEFELMMVLAKKLGRTPYRLKDDTQVGILLP